MKNWKKPQIGEKLKCLKSIRHVNLIKGRFYTVRTIEYPRKQDTTTFGVGLFPVDWEVFSQEGYWLTFEEIENETFVQVYFKSAENTL